MAAKKFTVVTDRYTPEFKRLELAAGAAWCATTLCDELLEQVGKIGMLDDPLNRPLLTIAALAARVKELAEAAAMCLEDDEKEKPFADLEKTVYYVAEVAHA